MPKLMFAWLGSGRTRKRDVDAGAQALDRAARAGLPVPAGAVLLDEFFRLALDNRLLMSAGERVVVAEPDALWATIFESVRLPHFDRPVEVRPATPAAGEGPQPPAGVDTADPTAFGRALAAAWSIGGPSPRRDVVLLETVEAVAEGTAVSRTAEDEDEITQLPLAPHALPRLEGWRRPDETRAPHEQRLQMLLRGVRHSLGRGDWAIAWADDGRVCWLRAVRRIGNPAT